MASEQWPVTNCALFPWSEAQITFVTRHFIAGSTRLVLTARYGVVAEDLVGQPITRRGGGTLPVGLVLHNAIGNLWNWTKVYPGFVTALNSACRCDDPASLVAPVQTWLRAEQPLSEALAPHSAVPYPHVGGPLISVHLVEIGTSGLVRRVLA